MAADLHGLSDKAPQVFAIAVHHRPQSGERVSSAIRRDGHGHGADPEGVAEREGRGLATASDPEISLGDEADGVVGTVVDLIRGASA